MNNESTGDAEVGQLVLARLLVAGEKGATTTELKRALDPILGHRWAGAALDATLTRALDGLESAGLVVVARKGKTGRGTLTAEGRSRALEFLGLDQLPPRLTWDQLKKTALAARALGLPTPSGKSAKLFGGDPGFKAALLKTQFGLPLDDFPTFDQAIDALAWTLIGFEPGPKFTLKAVKAALLGREIEGGRRVDPQGDFKKEAAKLLARNAGARQSGKDELRLAALRRWIDRATDPTTTATETETETATEPAHPLALPPDPDAFARRVVEAARESPSGRFGGNKVFVIHVWRALGNDPVFAALGLEGFKQRLAEANNARRLDLSRADMVEAMDAEDVRLSEVAYLGARFHFVRI